MRPCPARPTTAPSLSGSAGYTSSDPAAAVSGNLSYATTGVNAGSYDTAAGTLRLSGLYSHQQGYDISYGNASVNIDRKVLGIAGLAAQNKEYDGTPDATVTFTGLDGVVGTDIGNVGLTLGTANFADRNAGQNKAVTMTGSSLTGTAAGNYAITDSHRAQRPTSMPSPSPATIPAADKEYDGTTAATTSGSLTGVLAIDTDVGIATSGTFDNKNVGNKTVNVTGALTGDRRRQLHADRQHHDDRANITPKALTGTITAANKVYDGTTAATYQRPLTGMVKGDTVAIATTGSLRGQERGHGKTVNVTGTPRRAPTPATTRCSTPTRHDDGRHHAQGTHRHDHRRRTRPTTAPPRPPYQLAATTGWSTATRSTSPRSGSLHGQERRAPARPSPSPASLAGTDAGNYKLPTSTRRPQRDITAEAHRHDHRRPTRPTTAAPRPPSAAARPGGHGDTCRLATQRHLHGQERGHRQDRHRSTGSARRRRRGQLHAEHAGTATTANITAEAITGTITGDNKTYDGTTGRHRWRGLDRRGHGDT